MLCMCACTIEDKCAVARISPDQPTHDVQIQGSSCCRNGNGPPAWPRHTGGRACLQTIMPSLAAGLTSLSVVYGTSFLHSSTAVAVTAHAAGPGRCTGMLADDWAVPSSSTLQPVITYMRLSLTHQWACSQTTVPCLAAALTRLYMMYRISCHHNALLSPPSHAPGTDRCGGHACRRPCRVWRQP